MLFIFFGLSAKFFAFSVLSAALIVSTFIDLEHQIIPDEITLPGIILGVVLSLLFPCVLGEAGRVHSLLNSVAGVIAGGGGIFLTGILGKMAFKKEAMGGGDVKLMAMVGSFLGWKSALLVFFLAPFFGSVVGIIVKIKEKKDIIPYGPFLSLAAIIAVLWGERIINWLFLLP